MRKIGVDIKNGEFITYPGREVLPSLSGYVSKSYYKTVGNSRQLKVVLVDNDKEITINSIIGNVTNESLITTLIESEGKIELVLEKNSNNDRDYYLVKNLNKDA